MHASLLNGPVSPARLTELNPCRLIADFTETAGLKSSHGGKKDIAIKRYAIFRVNSQVGGAFPRIRRIMETWSAVASTFWNVTYLVSWASNIRAVHAHYLIKVSLTACFILHHLELRFLSIQIGRASSRCPFMNHEESSVLVSRSKYAALICSAPLPQYSALSQCLNIQLLEGGENFTYKTIGMTQAFKIYYI